MNRTVSEKSFLEWILTFVFSVVFTCTVTVFHKDVTDNQLGTCPLHGSASGSANNSSSILEPDNESALDNSTVIESVARSE